MISEYLFKGIDNIFANKFGPIKNTGNTKGLTRELIKANLHTVVKQNYQNADNTSPLKKSRLRTILEKNKSEQLRNVIRRDNSRSASPYQKINTRGQSPTQQNQKNDKITYYREQRKTIQKSRVLEKSRMGTSNSRIFKINTITSKSEEEPRTYTPHKRQFKNQQPPPDIRLPLKNIIKY